MIPIPTPEVPSKKPFQKTLSLIERRAYGSSFFMIAILRIEE
jgi:hypothetical protein